MNAPVSQLKVLILAGSRGFHVRLETVSCIDPDMSRDRAEDPKVYRVSLKGGQRGWLGGTFVMPDLGDRCVCCDAVAAELVAYDPSVDYQALGLVRVPLCAGCRSHVGRHALWRPLLTTLALVFGFGELTFAIGFGRMDHLPFALVALGAGVVVPILCRRRRIAAARRGHHREIALSARPGAVELRTTNRRLVDLLLDQGGALLD